MKLRLNTFYVWLKADDFSIFVLMVDIFRCQLINLAVRRIHTWQVGAALHSVCFLSITKAADVETQGLDIIDALCDHQVLMHQVAAVRARLEQKLRVHSQGS